MYDHGFVLNLRWMAMRGYFLGPREDSSRLQVNYSLWFTDGGTALRRVAIVPGPYDLAVIGALKAAQEDWVSHKPVRFLSYLKEGTIVAQIPTGLRDDEAIAIDKFLRNLGKIDEDEELATTSLMDHVEGGSSLDDPDLIQLIWSEDDHNAFTTFERMARHLVRCHGLIEPEIWGKAADEIQKLHTAMHEMPCDHDHPKPVVVCGHEPKGLEE
jgi:hypothetical protein